ncbi:MAG: HNH endonuclease [Eubacterium sp.]|nr:HNH endonuclease [Eubacterium sp.]
MPKRPNTPCKHPNCSRLVAYGNKYCNEHKPLHTDEVRSASSRGYNRQWQKASKAFLQEHPICEICKSKGRYTKATVVDHIIPHRGNRELFWDRSNWQSLCKSCHDTKTMTEDRYIKYEYNNILLSKINTSKTQ